MIERSVATRLLASAPTTALPGTWKLARGRAVTLRPDTDGILRIAHGRVWATVDGPHGGTPCDSGDHILQTGRSMYVQAGHRVVIEGSRRYLCLQRDDRLRLFIVGHRSDLGGRLLGNDQQVV